MFVCACNQVWVSIRTNEDCSLASIIYGKLQFTLFDLPYSAFKLWIWLSLINISASLAILLKGFGGYGTFSSTALLLACWNEKLSSAWFWVKPCRHVHCTLNQHIWFASSLVPQLTPVWHMLKSLLIFNPVVMPSMKHKNVINFIYFSSLRWADFIALGFIDNTGFNVSGFIGHKNPVWKSIACAKSCLCAWGSRSCY